jgi:diguanylate cyclase (GGDEF)-like protein
VPRPRPRSSRTRQPGTQRVWAFITVLITAAGLGYLVFVGRIVTSGGPIVLPWPVLAAGFALVEMKVIVVHFRRETHSFSLSEFPAVIGLFFLTPADYMLALLTGSTIALLFARQSAIKLAFNLANFAVIAAVELSIFHAIAHIGTQPTAIDWVAAFAATSAGSIISVFAIATVISLSGGAPQFQKLPEMIQFGTLVALANTSLALLAVTVMWIEPDAIWLLIVPLVALFVAYRAYISERENYERLELLYESSRILQHSPELDSALVALLDHARTMFRAEIAEVVLFDRDGRPDGLRTTSLHDEPPEVMIPVRLGPDDAVRRRLANDPAAFLVSGDAADRGDGRSVRQAMISPLSGEGGQFGFLRIANRLTNGTSFEADDLRLLETLTNQAAVALENGQLEQSLAELSRLKEELRYQAYHDPLTGLANRTMFAEQVDRALVGVGDGLVAAVLFLDLDDFKLVNDTLGHAAGDTLLAAVADRVRSCIRATDVAARLGGDEFAVLLDDDDTLERATAVANRMIEALRVPLPIGSQDLTVGGSIGIAVARTADQRTDELLRNADVAMYTAKAAGKNRMAVFEPTMHAAIVARHALSADLSRSVGRGELLVFYQPIVDLTTGAAVGAEALVRWQHPTRGLVSPDEFIPLAEENGVILSLGRWVLAEACRQTVDWLRDPGLPADFSINVNVSPVQIHQPEFIAEIEHVLALTGLPADRLVLELTETAMFRDTQATIAKLSALRATGVRVAVDDFGTGYSSLGYLRRFPVDILKIAREFIVGGEREPNEWAFAHAIVALGQTLGLKIVAEGIEDRAQVDRLIELGCEVGQGFHFSRPMDRQAFIRSLAGDPGPAAVARPRTADELSSPAAPLPASLIGPAF